MTQASDELLQTEESGQSVRAKMPFVQRLRQAEVWRPPDWLFCLAIGAIALVFNLYRLGDPSLWFDEILSVERARQSLPVLWHIIFSTQQNMALYYLLLHFWLSFTTLLGLHSTEFVVRFPSAIFAALGSIMVFLLGRRFMGVIGGMIGAGLYLLNVLQLVYAQEARSYSVQLLLICTGWYALFAALGLGSSPDSSGKEGQAAETAVHGQAAGQYRWWVYYVVAMTLAIYAHLFSVLILFAQVLTIGITLASQWRGKIRGQAWSNLPAAAVSLVSTGVLSIPMLLAARHGSKTGWLAMPHLHDISRLFLTISDNSIFYMLMLAACCALGIGAVVLAHPRYTGFFGDKAGDARLSWPQGLWPVLFALLCWLVVPVIASYVISQGHTRIFSSRYLVTIVPPLFLLVGLGIVALRWRVIQVLLAAILLLVALHHVPQYYNSAQVEDWRTPALWLEQHYQAGDGMVCYNNAQGCEVAIEYYLRAYPSGAQFPADSPGAFPWVNYDTTNRLGDFAAAVNPTLLENYGARHPRLFFIAGRFANNTEASLAQTAQHWLDTHYHLIAQSAKGAVTIRLYVTNTGAYYSH